MKPFIQAVPKRFGDVFGGLLGGQGAAAPENTAVPTSIGTPVLDAAYTFVAGTWTGTPVLTYQVQHQLPDTTWEDATGSGDTTLEYTPNAADFGLPLRIVETPDGDAGQSVTSDATARAAETPMQAYGSNVMNDGTMEAADTTAWTPFANAALSKQTTDPAVGSRYLRNAKNGTNYPIAYQPVLNASLTYDLAAYFRGDGTQRPRITLGATTGVDGTTSAAWQFVRGLGRPVNANASLAMIDAAADGEYVEFDEVIVRAITLNAQLTAPSANMDIREFYTLPVSPTKGDRLWLLPRISDYAAGNYWLGELLYTGTQWNMTLDSVASKTRISRTTAANVGATNGIRINCNGDLLDVFTSADGGANWTPRGSQVNNALYNTAQGVNVIASSAFTLESLTFAPAT